MRELSESQKAFLLVFVAFMLGIVTGPLIPALMLECIYTPYPNILGPFLMFFAWLCILSSFKKDNRWFYVPLAIFLIFTLVAPFLGMTEVIPKVKERIAHPPSQGLIGVKPYSFTTFITIFTHNSGASIANYLSGVSIILPFLTKAIEDLCHFTMVATSISCWHWKAIKYNLGNIFQYFEIPATYLSFIAGANVSRYMFKAIIDVLRTRKIRGNFGEVKEAFKWGLKLLKISIVLLFVAAIFETWWTPWWYKQIFP